MLSFAAEIFETIIKFRNTFYDRGIFKSVAAGSPVISVGNISAGGSGKTPFVKLTCEIIKKYGLRPAIVGRGYKRASKGDVVVRDESGILAIAEQAGDEMLWLAEKTGCPTLATEKKSDGAFRAVELFQPDAVVVDDAFQHRRLKRDLDVVLIAESDLERPFLIPHGRLREPLYSIYRADVVAIPEGIDNIYELPEFLRADALLIRFKRVFGKFETDAERNFAFAGIAKPERFFKMLRGENIPLTGELGLADHYRYDGASINNLIEKIKKSGSGVALTTEKDYVKLRRYMDQFEKAGVKLVAAPLEIELTLGAKEYEERVIGAIRRKLNA